MVSHQRWWWWWFMAHGSRMAGGLAGAWGRAPRSGAGPGAPPGPGTLAMGTQAMGTLENKFCNFSKTFNNFWLHCWHLLNIVVSFLNIPIYIYVTSFSRDSIYSKPSSSSCAGTGCLCCLLLLLLLHSCLCISDRFLAFPGHFLCISLAFPWHFRGLTLTFPWYCCEFSQRSYMRSIIFSGFHRLINYKASSSCFAETGWMFMLLIIVVAFPCVVS